MKSDSDSIPTDINELTSLVKELREQVTHQSLFIDQLLEQIKLARHHRFGVRSEHISPDQLRLLLEDNSKEKILSMMIRRTVTRFRQVCLALSPRIEVDANCLIICRA